MRNNLYKILLTGAVVLSMTACDDFLDVRPKAEKLEREQFSTAKGFEDAIYGVYGEMQTTDLYGKNLTWGVTELLAQNLTSSSTAAEALEKYDYTSNATVRKMFSSIWTKAYETVGHANNILDQLSKKSPADLPLYNYYKGEMLGARAMLHFELLRMFAPTDTTAMGIPYVTGYSPTVKPFETVGANYRHILSDLTEAVTLLRAERDIITYPRQDTNYDKFLNKQETHLNAYALEALLARVYWYMGDFSNAARHAESVIASGAFPLVNENEVKDYVAGVLSPKETIFGLFSTTWASTVKSYLYNYTTFFSYTPYYNGAFTGTNYIDPYTEIYARNISATEQDRRLDHFIQKKGYATWQKMVDYYNIEGNKRANEDSYIKGISILHVAEMYLIAADALFDTNYDLALRYFDAVVQSRGLNGYARQGKTLTHDILFDEYRKEMFGEGQTWYNMKRLNRDIKSNHANRVIPGSKAVYNIPIPEDEYEYRNQED